MKLPVIAVMVSCLLSAGCPPVERPKAEQIKEASALVTGLVVTPAKTDQQHQIVEPNKIETPKEYSLRMLTRYKVNPEYEYEVVLGAQSSASFLERDASWMLYSGWIYGAGNWPKFHTGRLCAGAVGSGVAVRIESDGTEHVFFLFGTEALVRVPDDEGSGATEYRWSDRGRFQELKPTDTVPQELPLSAYPELNSFLDEELKPRARAAGLAIE